ncbi:unnamed protein product [Peniophora sp. CBMAI 1063]|nr:unnamed protein product [Peniophora sp. CBMAI 1063]
MVVPPQSNASSSAVDAESSSVARAAFTKEALRAGVMAGLGHPDSSVVTAEILGQEVLRFITRRDRPTAAIVLQRAKSAQEAAAAVAYTLSLDALELAWSMLQTETRLALRHNDPNYVFDLRVYISSLLPTLKFPNGTWDYAKVRDYMSMGWPVEQQTRRELKMEELGPCQWWHALRYLRGGVLTRGDIKQGALEYLRHATATYASFSSTRAAQSAGQGMPADDVRNRAVNFAGRPSRQAADASLAALQAAIVVDDHDDDNYVPPAPAGSNAAHAAPDAQHSRGPSAAPSPPPATTRTVIKKPSSPWLRPIRFIGDVTFKIIDYDAHEARLCNRPAGSTVREVELWELPEMHGLDRRRILIVLFRVPCGRCVTAGCRCIYRGNDACLNCFWSKCKCSGGTPPDLHNALVRAAKPDITLRVALLTRMEAKGLKWPSNIERNGRITTGLPAMSLDDANAAHSAAAPSPARSPAAAPSPARSPAAAPSPARSPAPAPSPARSPAPATSPARSPAPAPSPIPSPPPASGRMPWPANSALRGAEPGSIAPAVGARRASSSPRAVAEQAAGDCLPGSRSEADRATLDHTSSDQAASRPDTHNAGTMAASTTASQGPAPQISAMAGAAPSPPTGNQHPVSSQRRADERDTQAMVAVQPHDHVKDVGEDGPRQKKHVSSSVTRSVSGESVRSQPSAEHGPASRASTAAPPSRRWTMSPSDVNDSVQPPPPPATKGAVKDKGKAPAIPTADSRPRRLVFNNIPPGGRPIPQLGSVTEYPFRPRSVIPDGDMTVDGAPNISHPQPSHAIPPLSSMNLHGDIMLANRLEFSVRQEFRDGREQLRHWTTGTLLPDVVLPKLAAQHAPTMQKLDRLLEGQREANAKVERMQVDQISVGERQARVEQRLLALEEQRFAAGSTRSVPSGPSAHGRTPQVSQPRLAGHASRVDSASEQPVSLADVGRLILGLQSQMAGLPDQFRQEWQKETAANAESLVGIRQDLSALTSRMDGFELRFGAMEISVDGSGRRGAGNSNPGRRSGSPSASGVAASALDGDMMEDIQLQLAERSTEAATGPDGTSSAPDFGDTRDGHQVEELTAPGAPTVCPDGGAQIALPAAANALAHPGHQLAVAQEGTADCGGVSSGGTRIGTPPGTSLTPSRDFAPSSHSSPSRHLPGSRSSSGTPVPRQMPAPALAPATASPMSPLSEVSERGASSHEDDGDEEMEDAAAFRGQKRGAQDIEGADAAPSPKRPRAPSPSGSDVDAEGDTDAEDDQTLVADDSRSVGTRGSRRRRPAPGPPTRRQPPRSAASASAHV